MSWWRTRVRAAATYTDASVAAETRYTYRIKAINQYGASERSRWYHIDTPAAPEPETDPADLAPVQPGRVTDGRAGGPEPGTLPPRMPLP